jgi:hypothetical protein
MHGIRGTVEKGQIGKDVNIQELDEQDRVELCKHMTDCCGYFGLTADEILKEPFIKLDPVSVRSYGQLYVP